MPTRNPTDSVLVMAVVNEGIWKMRANTSSVKPPPEMNESTSSMASG